MVLKASDVRKTNRWQHKVLAADVETGDTDFLVFSNLTIGKTYRYSGHIKVEIDDQQAAIVYIRHDGVNVKEMIADGDTADVISVPIGFDYVFTATNTSVSLRTSGGVWDANDRVESGASKRSWAQLEEINNSENVSVW